MKFILPNLTGTILTRSGIPNIGNNGTQNSSLFFKQTMNQIPYSALKSSLLLVLSMFLFTNMAKSNSFDFDDLANDNLTTITCEVHITFVNTGCQPLELIWDNNGHHVSYGIIAPGEQKVQRTFEGHKWKFKANGTFLPDRFTGGCHNKTVNVNSFGCEGDPTYCDDCFVYEGSIDYTVIGNSMSKNETRHDCGQKSSTSANLSIPTGASIVSAYLQWSGTGHIDHHVKLNGTNVGAFRTFEEHVSDGNNTIKFFGAYADVTSLVQNGGSYTVSDLHWDNSHIPCQYNAAYGAWSMVVIYETNSPETCNIHLCQGDFSLTYPAGHYNRSIKCVDIPPGCPSSGSQLTIVAFEGDNYKGEDLYIGGQFFGDNNFRGQTAPNLDILNFDVSNLLNSSSSSLDYKIKTRSVNTSFGPATEGLLDFVKVLKYKTCQAPITGSIGNLVFEDTDGDGFRDAGEPGIPNVTVKLQNPAGVTLQTTMTNGNGNYSFTDLPAGQYKVMFNTPAGFTASPQIGNANNLTDNNNDNNGATQMTDVFTLNQGQNNPTIDAGFEPEAQPQITINDITVNEENGTATLQICIDQASNSNVFVTYSTANGSALVGQDFSNTSGTAVIQAGQTCTNVSIPITNDDNPEQTEQFVVNLTNPNGAVISDNQGTVTILDNDMAPVTPQITINDVTVNEADGTATLTLTLSSPTTNQVSLNLTTSNGSATTPEDYVPVSTIVTFPAGSTSQTVTFPIVDNNIDEQTELFNANLSNATNATIADNQGTVTILDDDTQGNQCTATYTVNGRTINISNISAPITLVKILDNSWNTVFECSPWTNTCGSNISFNTPECGTYWVQIQTYQTWSNQICNILESVNVNTNCGQTVDCPALNANIGDACNDGNPNTINDQVNANCQCVGTPITQPCSITAFVSNIVCNNRGTATPSDDTYSFNITANITNDGGWGYTVNGTNIFQQANGSTATISGLAISQGTQTFTVGDSDITNCTTTITVTPPATCSGNIPTVDCPNLGLNIGDTCDDGNPNTFNDVVQQNCSCAGTPATGGCNVTYSVNGLSVTVSNLTDPITAVKLLTSSWATVEECNAWSTACGNSITFTAPSAGDYYLQIQTYADWSTPICNLFETIKLEGGNGPVYDCPALAMNIGDACNDGNPNTINDIVQSNCSCAGTPVNTGCSNVTDGGIIGGEQTICSGEDAAPITNIAFPSGGSGAMEYIWLKSTTGCPNALSQVIPHATSSTYDPGALTQTTYFRRCSRRASCNNDIDWLAGESNCIKVTVDQNCGGNNNGNNGCTASYTINGNVISFTGITGAIRSVKVLDNTWNPIFSCNDWTNNCGTSFDVTCPTSGTHWVQIQTYADWSTTICDILESVNMNGSGFNRIGLLNLHATTQQGLVQLDWTNNTGSEVDHFELERSVDGINFENIGTIEVASLDDRPTHYSQKDGNPLLGYNYYRVNMINLNGNSIQSNVKRVTIADLEDFGLFPNPAQETVNVSLRGYEGSDIKIQLIDGFGKRLKVVSMNNVSDSVYEVDLNDVKNGVYSLWIFSDGKRPTGKKMIVSKSY